MYDEMNESIARQKTFNGAHLEQVVGIKTSRRQVDQDTFMRKDLCIHISKYVHYILVSDTLNQK